MENKKEKVLVYFADEDYCITFESSNREDNIYILAETLCIGSYNKYILDDYLFLSCDRFYPITNNCVHEVCELCDLYELEGIKIDIAKNFPLNK